MFSRMKILVLYFNLWGFPQFRVLLHQQKCDRFSLSIHLALVLIATLVLCAFFQRPTNDNLGSLNDATKMFANLIIYWLSLLELNYKQRTQQKFWAILKKQNQYHGFSLKVYLFKLVIYFILLSIMFLNYYITFISVSESALILYGFWFCYTLIVMFCKHHLFYYLFFVEFIKHELKMVINELDNIRFKRAEFKNRNAFVNKSFSNRVKLIRSSYGSIYDLCDILNTVFGWSNVLAISFQFLLILADINWIYWKLLNFYRIDLIGEIFNEFHLPFTAIDLIFCNFGSEFSMAYITLVAIVLFIFQTTSNCYKLVIINQILI